MHNRIRASRCETLAVGRPSDTQRSVRVPFARWNRKAGEKAPGRGVPDLNCLASLFGANIASRRSDAHSAPRPCHGPEGRRLPPIGQYVTTALRIPHLDRSILARRGDPRPIRRPGYPSHWSRVPGKGEEATPTRRVPDLNAVIIAARSDARAVRRPRYREDRAGMPVIGAYRQHWPRRRGRDGNRGGSGGTGRDEQDQGQAQPLTGATERAHAGNHARQSAPQGFSPFKPDRRKRGHGTGRYETTGGFERPRLGTRSTRSCPSLPHPAASRPSPPPRMGLRLARGRVVS